GHASGSYDRESSRSKGCGRGCGNEPTKGCNSGHTIFSHLMSRLLQALKVIIREKFAIIY
ncbi:13403_t:CDS:2, partial [Funneliformis geosporum]